MNMHGAHRGLSASAFTMFREVFVCPKQTEKSEFHISCVGSLRAAPHRRGMYSAVKLKMDNLHTSIIWTVCILPLPPRRLVLPSQLRKCWQEQNVARYLHDFFSLALCVNYSVYLSLLFFFHLRNPFKLFNFSSYSSTSLVSQKCLPLLIVALSILAEWCSFTASQPVWRATF